MIFNNAWGKDASEENMISGIMHGRDGRIVNFDRWLQRCYPLAGMGRFAACATMIERASNLQSQILIN